MLTKVLDLICGLSFVCRSDDEASEVIWPKSIQFSIRQAKWLMRVALMAANWPPPRSPDGPLSATRSRLVDFVRFVGLSPQESDLELVESD